jgi:hypothetical protein
VVEQHLQQRCPHCLKRLMVVRQLLREQALS